MATKMIEQSIEVDVPVRTAYNQWTQFEDFPHFMDNVRKVRQIDDTHLHWETEIGGIEREFQAEITEQTPDQRVAWRALGDVHHAGVVTFHKLDDTTTRVMLQLEIEPEDWKEKAASVFGVLDNQTKQDLERFKTFIETRGEETGAWRGEVDQDPTG